MELQLFKNGNNIMETSVEYPKAFNMFGEYCVRMHAFFVRRKKALDIYFRNGNSGGTFGMPSILEQVNHFGKSRPNQYQRTYGLGT